MSFNRGCCVTALAVALGIMTGCAPTIRLQVTKPAEVNMKGAKKLAVMDYGFPVPNKSMSGEDLLKAAFAKIVGIQLQQQQEETPEAKVARCATIKTSAVLTATQYFTVLTPSDLNKTFAGGSGQSLAATDIGKKAGAQSIILGDIEQLTMKDEDISDSYKKKDGTVVTENKVRRTVGVQLSYRVIATETGGILATKTLRGEVQQTVMSDDRRSLNSKENLGCQAIDEVIPAMAKQLAPYKIVETRKLMKDKTKNPEFDKALNFLKGNMYDKAYEIFTQIYKQSENVAAGYNAAIMKEAMGDIEGAYNEMTAIASKSADANAIREVSRLKSAVEDQKKALSQM